MKSYSVIINTILFFAVGVLYILFFTRGTSDKNAEISEESAKITEGTKVVYVNTDTLLSKYLLSVELNEAFLKKQEDRSTELNMKVKDLDRQSEDYQRKIANNGYLSRERAENAYRDLLIKRDQLLKLQEEMTEEMLKEQTELNRRLIEDITGFLKEYNKDKGYDIILSTVMAGTVLYSERGFDITGDVVEKLNASYKMNTSK